MACALLHSELLTLGAAPLPMVKSVEAQPLAAQVTRVAQALEFLGEPLPADVSSALTKAASAGDIEAVQTLLDARCLFGVHINAEMRVKVQQGPAAPGLVEQGWRSFLVKVANEAGTTAQLQAVSPNARAPYDRGGKPAAGGDSEKFYGRKDVPSSPDDLWLDLAMYDKQPLRETLGGLGLEYRIVQLFSRDAGKREAKISFNAGQGTQDLGFRNEADVLFTAQPTKPVVLRVKDENDKSTTAAFLIRDSQKRVYPAQSKRLAPDFFFHSQVYRADGEFVRLPAGAYSIEFSRGPESLPQKRDVTVTDKTGELEFKVRRWIDPSKFGWWSGDHHIHAAGCAHYTKPSEGVLPKDMIRHVMGEDLKVGANLTWGPGFDYQKQFFCGTVDKVSQYPYLLRYDIEVSQFGSHVSGHLVLLRLTEQMYPGGDSKDHWPTLGLNTLRWAKKQGAVCGPAHSGSGLDVKTTELPNYILPPYNGIGANEYVVDITHEVPGPDGKLVPAVDFTSTVDTQFRSELNMWYHALNCGFRQRISGETDFPCISGDRVGMGRSYVKLDGKLDYDQWCEGIRQGRCYVSEGRSHLIDLTATIATQPNERAAMTTLGVGERQSELKLARPGTVQLRAKVSALLDEKPSTATGRFSWNIEHARLGKSREVPVELIVNGYPVAQTNIVADGQLNDVALEAKVERSSWMALRILPSSHSNPFFVLVDGKPIRASRRSADWCLKGVDQCWSQKERTYKAAEMEAAKAAYAHARETYRKILAECEVD